MNDVGHVCRAEGRMKGSCCCHHRHFGLKGPPLRMRGVGAWTACWETQGSMMVMLAVVVGYHKYSHSVVVVRWHSLAADACLGQAACCCCLDPQQDFYIQLLEAKIADEKVTTNIADMAVVECIAAAAPDAVAAEVDPCKVFLFC